MRRATASLTAAVLASGVWGSAALAREPIPQPHEVRLEIDLGVQQQGNNVALIDTQYTYTPGGIDRNDELPPILRRFVLHPSSVSLHIVHDGSTREAITSVRAGAELQPLDGAIYAKVEGGFGRHLTIFEEPYEFGYWFGTVTGEIGFRPASQLTFGAFYQGEPTISAIEGNNLGIQARRSGLEQTFGLTTTFADPSDRLYATFTGFGHIADWTFSGLNIGDTSIRGWGASGRVAYNASLTTSIQLRGTVKRDHWVDSRLGETDSTNAHFIGMDTDLQVWSIEGGADLIFWALGRYGFRVSLGGGWLGRAPLYNTSATALISLGGAIQLRF